jgi:transposase
MQTREELLAENLRLKELLHQRETAITERDEKIAELNARMDWLTRQYFGSGKSEKFDRAQLLLELEDVASELAKLKGETETVTYERPKPKPRTHQSAAEHFENLPVRETVVIDPEEVKADPELYEKIGEERTFEVDVTPPQLFKREIVRTKWRHRIVRSQPPVLAPAAVRPVEGGYASAGLLAFVVLSKYLDHLPLYRLEKMSVRWGARISRKTMADWVEIVAFWLKPIYDRMRRDLIEGPYIQADETKVKYLDPDSGKRKASSGYLWFAGRPNGPVVCDWRLGRAHEYASALLRGFAGTLQADGYQAYDALAGKTEGLVRVGCLAHVRRKWFDSLEKHPREAGLALRTFARIYAKEAAYREERLGPDERTARRKAELSVLFARLRRLARICRDRTLPKSDLGKAAAYTLSQWSSIEALLDHGEAEVDNNLIENAIRPSAIGKKNWLFVGSPEAGGRSAVVYSVLITCQRFGIDPHEYLRDVLARVPAMSNQADYTGLMPQNWKPEK